MKDLDILFSSCLAPEEPEKEKDTFPVWLSKKFPSLTKTYINDTLQLQLLPFSLQQQVQDSKVSSNSALQYFRQLNKWKKEKAPHPQFQEGNNWSISDKDVY